MADNEAEPHHNGNGNGHVNGNGNGNGYHGRKSPDGLEFIGEVGSLSELSIERPARLAQRPQPLERMVPVMDEAARPAGASDSAEVMQAHQQAQRIVAEAQREAQALKREAEKYAFQVLSELEAEISRALSIVRNGRQFIGQRRRTTTIASPTIARD